jgi:hypothetical protein
MTAITPHIRLRVVRIARQRLVALALLLVGLLVGASSAWCARIEVIVDSALYSQAQSSLSLYVSDLQHYGYDPVLWEYTGGGATAVRDHLAQSAAGLDGAVLVGNIPSLRYSAGGAAFSSDYYYMDLDGTWGDANGDGIYDSQTGNVTPEIWVGRLTPNASAGDIAAIERYVAKHHLYAQGRMGFGDASLLYIDDDWWFAGPAWQAELAKSGWNVELVNTPALTTAADYESRLDAAQYQWLKLVAHSDQNRHYFFNGTTPAGRTEGSEIAGLDPQIGFYEFFACNSGDFTYADYLAGRYIFDTDWGMAAIAPTNAGGMTQTGSFYLAINNTQSIGDAMLSWFNERGADGFTDYERSQYFGLTIIGDPTIAPTAAHHMPEPGTAALLLLGLPALIWRRRRGQQAGG